MRPFEAGGPARFVHQRAGLDKLIKTGGLAALLFDPGLGKTAVLLDYASLLALTSKEGEARILVVAPLAAVDTWVLQAEIFMSPQVHYWAEAVGGSIEQRGATLAARGGNPFRDTLTGKVAARAEGVHRAWAWGARGSEARRRPITPSEGPDGLGTDKPRVILEIINIDTLASRMPYKSKTLADYMVDAIKRYDPHLLVVDESHKIKGVKTNASMLLARLTDHVKRRVLLTGTVMPHSPLDVFGQWRFLDPYAFGYKNRDGTIKQATYTAFRTRFAVYGGYMGYQVLGWQNLEDMQAIMARNAVVARKADALDLPPTTDVEVPVHLDPAEAKAYSEMKQQLATLLAPGVTATVPNRLTQMLRLRQITAGHVPDDNDVLQVIGRSKVDVIKSLVEDTLAGETRIVVFAFFTQEIRMLEAALRVKGTEVEVIQGGTPTQERAAIRKRFGSNDPARIVLVAQVKTLSLAVNELVTANHAIFASLSQQRDDMEQAKARLDRQGQTKPVTFWYALAPGTVDEVIMRSHRDRTSLETAMLRHIREGDEQA